MVLTRKTSVPMPPTSRSPSSQATPKLNKGKAPQGSKLSQEIETTFSNGVTLPEANYNGPQFSDDALFSDGSPPRKISKVKPKGKAGKKERGVAKRRKQSSSWLDFFSRMFILAFLIYSLSVCPTDKEQSLVCRGLSEYRRLILEPYMISPFQNLLKHPSVSPYTTPVIDTVKPVIHRSQKEWNARVVPQWNTRVAPQWNNHVVPQWNAHVAPYVALLDAKVDPYRQTVKDSYKRNAAPYVAKIQHGARKTRPYILITAARTYDAYSSSKPYFAHAYRQLQRVPPYVVKYVVTPLATARRQFVDPHVALLVEKVKELSSGTTKVIPSQPSQETIVSTPVTASASTTLISAEGANEHVEVELPPVPEATEGDEKLASAASVISASMFLDGSATESVPGATYSAASERTLQQPSTDADSKEINPEDIVEVGSENNTELGTATDVAAPAETIAEEETGRFADDPSVSVLDAASDSVSSAVPELVETVIDAASTAPSLVAPTPSEPSATLSSEVYEPSQPVSSSANADDEESSDDDLDDFYAELGLDVDETASTSGVLEAESSPSVVEETEEEKAAREAARIAAVAEKRRNIQARHAVWEEKLAATIEEQSIALRDALESIRRTAAVELKTNGVIRDAVETLHTEAEKALRGTDAYFTKLKQGDKPRDEQARLWDRVLGKVQAKFEGRMKSVEEIVNNWYQNEVLSKEGQEIEGASRIVRNAAEDGQTDIGLDYAWLDDVTYMDWRRYHALLEKHGEWLDESLSKANGSHSSPFPNPVMDALEDLQAEVHDITVGFETRLRRIKREGDRAFTLETPSEADAQVPAPGVSILPIYDDGTAQGKAEEKVLQEVSDAILGRSGEEIVAALNRAEEWSTSDQDQAKVVHEEL
ncbi:hypothetical protein M0805_003612 [Coniferiporia weirii]|nr:hypothetical protein M0805_003612 [Coniferiporia weirii]